MPPGDAGDSPERKVDGEAGGCIAKGGGTAFVNWSNVNKYTYKKSKNA